MTSSSAIASHWSFPTSNLLLWAEKRLNVLIPPNALVALHAVHIGLVRLFLRLRLSNMPLLPLIVAIVCGTAAVASILGTNTQSQRQLLAPSQPSKRTGSRAKEWLPRKKIKQVTPLDSVGSCAHKATENTNLATALLWLRQSHLMFGPKCLHI